MLHKKTTVMDNFKSFFIPIVLECCRIDNTPLNSECSDILGILNEEDNTHKNEHCHFTKKKFSEDRISTESSETINLDTHER